MAESARQRVRWDIEYDIHLGETWGRFMAGLRERRTLANGCPSCRRVFVPPQAYCEACFERTTDWSEAGQEGDLRVFTVVREGVRGGTPTPYVVGSIQLDGTDTMLMTFVGGIDAVDAAAVRAQLPEGRRVAATWSEERSGTILDIACFAPAGGTS